ncbi:MAG: glucuronate isomerase, partial [Luteolibacter sp.]
IDYHCHLSPEEVATNKCWDNLSEIWLGGDHYKWRLMRANGIAEERITGDASPRDKFEAWAETVPYTLRNPIHHWTHLELQRYFDIDLLLSPSTSDLIWERANAKLKEDSFCAHGILDKFDVRMVGTTDDPADPLDHHHACKELGIKTLVAPTFRPDKAFAVEQPDNWLPWVKKLAAISGVRIGSLSDLLSALKKRHDEFHAAGSRLSDHGFDRLPMIPCTDEEASSIFDKAFNGDPVSSNEQEKFAFYLMLQSGRWDAEKGWTKQLHLGVVRNVNRKMLAKVGPDAGFDTINDTQQGPAVLHYLDTLASEDSLPNIILYNLNPRDNYLFAALTGAFQDGKVAGKIQFGSGWWFLDQKDGMELQMNALSSTGLISRFVGMLTDSRSFLSYPRHEYFRRILCNLIGSEVDRGELPDDFESLSQLIEDICFGNAKRMFGIQ